LGLREILTTEDGQEQVDEEVGAAATLKEDTERRKQDGEDDLDDVAVCGLAGVAVVFLVSPVASVWFADAPRNKRLTIR
jgi:hypothetical protein